MHRCTGQECSSALESTSSLGCWGPAYLAPGRTSSSDLAVGPHPRRGRKLLQDNGGTGLTVAHSRERARAWIWRDRHPFMEQPWVTGRKIRMKGVSGHGFRFQYLGGKRDFCILQKRMAWSRGAAIPPDWIPY